MNNLVESLEDFDILRPLKSEELNYLKNLYEKYLSTTSYHYYSICNQIKWNRQIEKLPDSSLYWGPFRKVFYTHRHGNFQINGTYFSFSKDSKITISFHSLESSLEELIECLEKTNRIDWSAGPLLAGVDYNFKEMVESISIQRHGILERGRHCFCFLIKKDIGKSLEVPTIVEDYEVRSLSLNHAKQIHAEWPNKKEGSVDFIKGLIKLNKSFGIFHKENDKLVAWVIQNEYGGVGILQVILEERRKKFATLLAVKLTKEISLSNENIDVTAFTVWDNLNSQGLLKKIGFKKIVSTFWMQYKNLLEI